jgi:hypothetical protein
MRLVSCPIDSTAASWLPLGLRWPTSADYLFLWVARIFSTFLISIFARFTFLLSECPLIGAFHHTLTTCQRRSTPAALRIRTPASSARRNRPCASQIVTVPGQVAYSHGRLWRLPSIHIHPGNEVEFAVQDDGTVTVRGYVSIPTDQAWFFTPDWLAGEREADEEIAAGRGTVHESAEDMFAHLDSLDTPAE